MRYIKPSSVWFFCEECGRDFMRHRSISLCPRCYAQKEKSS